MIDLAINYGGKLLNSEEISQKNNIPHKYLEQILVQLKRAGYLKSKKGVGGGYSLSKPPDAIFLAEIVRLLDGALAPVNSVSKYYYEHSPIEKNAKLISLFQEIRNFVANKMETTSLKDLL